jgi:hypothetical protein
MQWILKGSEILKKKCLTEKGGNDLPVGILFGISDNFSW